MSILALVVCGAAATLYALGRRGRPRRRREACFYGAVVATFVVLEPPFDTLSERWLAVHMAQHVVLLTVVPPLVVLGRPWPRMWLPFPLSARRAVGGALAGSAAFRAVGRVLMRPPVALALQSAALGIWHIPALYDAAVHSETVHVLEHVSFVAPALLFWGALLEAPPVRARIDHLHRAGWFALAMVPGWILAIVLAFAKTPLYGAYHSLSNQQLGAGVMWVPGSLTYFICAFIAFYRWLEPSVAEPRPEELSWT